MPQCSETLKMRTGGRKITHRCRKQAEHDGAHIDVRLEKYVDDDGKPQRRYKKFSWNS